MDKFEADELETVWKKAIDPGKHLTNVHISNATDEMVNLERSGREHMSLTRGPAKATATMSSEQLKAAGMVGLYSLG